MLCYKPGKADWFASGLPGEGKQGDSPSASDLAKRDVPRSRLNQSIAEVFARMEQTGWEMSVVIDDADVVLGIVRRTDITSTGEPLDSLIDPGPRTVRPNTTLSELSDYLQQSERDYVLVTTSYGKLMGVVYRSAVEEKVQSAAQSSEVAA